MTPVHELFLQQLPEGWFRSEGEVAVALHAELQRELPPGHLLFEKAVAVIAHREGTDDILCRDVTNPSRFTVVHLSWSGREEINSLHPIVEVDGEFKDFLEYDASCGMSHD